MMGTGCPVYVQWVQGVRCFCSVYRVASVFEPGDGKSGIFERSFLGVLGLLALTELKVQMMFKLVCLNLHNMKYQKAFNHQETTKNKND